MTWGGAQGFQSEPKADSFQLADYGGSVGVIHTERKLTYAEVKLSGHMIPQVRLITPLPKRSRQV